MLVNITVQLRDHLQCLICSYIRTISLFLGTLLASDASCVMFTNTLIKFTTEGYTLKFFPLISLYTIKQGFRHTIILTFPFKHVMVQKYHNKLHIGRSRFLLRGDELTEAKHKCLLQE